MLIIGLLQITGTWTAKIAFLQMMNSAWQSPL